MFAGTEATTRSAQLFSTLLTDGSAHSVNADCDTDETPHRLQFHRAVLGDRRFPSRNDGWNNADEKTK